MHERCHTGNATFQCRASARWSPKSAADEGMTPSCVAATVSGGWLPLAIPAEMLLTVPPPQ